MKCPRCKKEVHGKLTRDHVVPQVLIKMLNYYGIEYPHSTKNIKMVCFQCNNSRGHKAINKETTRLVDKLTTLNFEGKICLKATDLQRLKEIKYWK